MPPGNTNSAKNSIPEKFVGTADRAMVRNVEWEGPPLSGVLGSCWRVLDVYRLLTHCVQLPPQPTQKN